MAKQDRPDQYNLWRMLIMPENRDSYTASLEVTDNGTIFAAFSGYMRLYRLRLTRENKFSIASSTIMPSAIYSICCDSRSDPTTLYVCLKDNSVRILSVFPTGQTKQFAILELKYLRMYTVQFTGLDVTLCLYFHSNIEQDEFTSMMFTHSTKEKAAQLVRSDVEMECSVAMRTYACVQPTPSTLIMYNANGSQLVEFEIKII